VSCHNLSGYQSFVNFEGPQIGRDMKTALRNVYDKVAASMPPVLRCRGSACCTAITFERGEFCAWMFSFPGNVEQEKDVIRRQLHDYVVAFDTGMAPAVGRQLTIAGALTGNDSQVFELLASRAGAGDCDLIARGWEGKSLRGWLYRNGTFQGDRRGEATLAPEVLLASFMERGEPLTLTCVPPGDGWRSALDRNLDGYFDGDEGI
jgi:hypothetical protein